MEDWWGKLRIQNRICTKFLNNMQPNSYIFSCNDEIIVIAVKSYYTMEFPT